MLMLLFDFALGGGTATIGVDYTNLTNLQGEIAIGSTFNNYINSDYR